MAWWRYALRSIFSTDGGGRGGENENQVEAPTSSARCGRHQRAGCPRPGIRIAGDDPTGDAKERLLRDRRRKYEAGLADATDELTSHQRALQKNEWAKESAREQLGKLGKKLLREVRVELRRRAAKDRQAIINAMLLRPLYRLFKRLPVGWKFVVLSPVVWLAYVTYRDWYDGAWIGLLVLVVFVFAMLVPILFRDRKTAAAEPGAEGHQRRGQQFREPALLLRLSV